jgi:hypothetical protein
VLTPLASTNPSTESAAGGDTLDVEGDDDDITTGGLTLALDIDDAPQPDTPTTAQAGA